MSLTKLLISLTSDLRCFAFPNAADQIHAGECRFARDSAHTISKLTHHRITLNTLTASHENDLLVRLLTRTHGEKEDPSGV